MKKTVAIGDIHGRSSWKSIIRQENPDRTIFVGDYFDSYDIPCMEQIRNFEEIIEYKQSGQSEVILLIGNHCHHYFPEIGYTGTSGYQEIGKYQIEHIIDTNREHLQMAYSFSNYLFTHAGVSTVFMNDVFGIGGWSVDNVVVELNELFRYKPRAFEFTGWDPYGNDDKQTPIWIRPQALMRSNTKTELKSKYIQVFGHTQQDRLDLNAIKKTVGNKYYCIDCLGTSGEYLIIEGTEIRVGSIWKS